MTAVVPDRTIRTGPPADDRRPGSSEHIEHTVAHALEALRAGRPVLVADDASRENEVDVVLAAVHATTEWVAWTVRHTSGYLCAPMPADRADALGLPLMWENGEDPRRTAYTVSVDARGVGTGISAADRALTLRTLADPASTAADLIRPGHVLPLRARPGGVAERPGHTEASVDLVRLAGLDTGTGAVAGIAELVADDGAMLRYDDALRLAEAEGLVLVTVSDIAEHRGQQRLGEPAGEAATTPGGDTPPDRPRVVRVAEALLPTVHGTFRVTSYRDTVTGAEHLGLVPDATAPDTVPDTVPDTAHGVTGLADAGPGADAEARPALVRMHSECLTGDALGSLRCDCGPQLAASLEAVSAAAAEGRAGAVVYLRGHEGRGIGLADKIAAYALQDGGLDTVDANSSLGLPVDAREYGAAAAILGDLGIGRVELLTNNPAKTSGLQAEGIDVVGRRPLQVGAGPHNAAYLSTKRDRMGHLLEVAR
ncbi:3,4-dihydroxy-2-butanone-4-phosphate synthase [Myceligenerans pegani]|uniref:GTP cyclohydrolase-2 n=1 Tax=Myceligenerans pegani TaxID=2776917 RepID=A0ABR9MV95_9MICO|nr:3,4-dihydroxy-2-butanone-4-phosphate synthase [Myceligenerans sp. TRM 65318]MBE1874961.1 3,4-dihydroxy-2-butanone-4-phosphate synthase [Myceligenerans sp. TRM 65318]MBE3017232.1 3,4-dihydroxy-2-butanone-4-phosphate synthase [Myceligenerans sp. TRM 65318]